MKPDLLKIGFGDLLAYSDNCRRVLRETLKANPEAFVMPLKPPLIEFATIRDIVVHMCGADERWIKMRVQGLAIENYTDRAPATIVGVFADWDLSRDYTKQFVDTLIESDFDRVYKLRLGDSWEGELTLRQILFHILTHEVHHRGQISMALQQMGIDAPDFDYIFHSE